MAELARCKGWRMNPDGKSAGSRRRFPSPGGEVDPDPVLVLLDALNAIGGAAAVISLAAQGSNQLARRRQRPPARRDRVAKAVAQVDRELLLLEDDLKQQASVLLRDDAPNQDPMKLPFRVGRGASLSNDDYWRYREVSRRVSDHAQRIRADLRTIEDDAFDLFGPPAVRPMGEARSVHDQLNQVLEREGMTVGEAHRILEAAARQSRHLLDDLRDMLGARPDPTD